MKKTILIISIPAYPLFQKEKPTIYSGSEFALFNIANYLDRNLFNVHFITGNFGQEKIKKENNITIYRSSKIKNVGIFYGLFNTIKLFFLIRKINPDVIFSSSAGWLTVELIIIKKLLRKKYVFRSSHIKNINGFTDQKSYGWLYRKLINQIDCFILQNSSDKEVLKKNFNYSGKTVHMRNLQLIPAEKPLDFSNRTCVLWVGRSEKIKKPESLLEIAKLTPNKNFIMIMPKTNQAVFDGIANLAKKNKNLEIIPGIERKNIMNFYKKALYLVSTSEGEGFPNVIVEAMKNGTPIISSLDYDDIIKQNNCGFIAQNSHAISKIINETEKENWDIQSNNCRNFAIDNFDIKKGIQQYEKIFYA